MSDPVLGAADTGVSEADRVLEQSGQIQKAGIKAIGKQVK